MAISTKEIKKYNEDAAKSYTTGQTSTPGKAAGISKPTTIKELNANGYKINSSAAANGISSSGGKSVMGSGGTGITTGPQQMTGIRNAMVSDGFDNAKIGWDGTNVTYDGQYFIKPSKVTDGTSYATKEDIAAAAAAYNTGKKQSVAGDGTLSAGASDLSGAVAARDYVASSGITNLVDWSDGKLIVAGTVVPVDKVDEDGTAYASKKAIDAAVNNYKNSAGIVGDKAVYDNWENKYGGRIEDALSKITDRDKWSYDPYKDAAYLAYKNQYEREGNRAYQNAYASMAGGTGGYGNSAAVTAAGQQLNYYQQQLNDRVPELMRDDYNRYVNEQELNRQALASIMEVGNNDYDKAYTANNDAYNRVNAAAAAAYERRQNELYNNPLAKQQIELNKETLEQAKQQTAQGAVDTDYYERNAAADLVMKELQNTSQSLTNESKRLNNVLEKYQKTNPNIAISAQDAAAAGIPQMPDGTYPSYYDITMAAADLEAATGLKIWNEYGKIEYNDQLWEQVAANVSQAQQTAGL